MQGRGGVGCPASGTSNRYYPLESIRYSKAIFERGYMYLVYPYQDQGIHCLWFSPTNIEIDKIQYSWPLNRDSIYLYKHCYSGKEMKMDGHILRSVIECCKRKGYNKCYITATGRNQSLLSLLKKEGFDKFRYIRYTSWFGKPTYRVYQRNLE